VEQRVAVDGDQFRGSGATVDDARGLASVAQAAARSGTLLFAFECDYFHVKLQK
jgi:hypothetical protein